MKGLFKGIQSVINTLETIIDGVKMAIQFLINLVTSLIQQVILLGKAITKLNLLAYTLPTWLIAFAVTGIAIAVLYVILGRQAGKSD